MHYSSSQRSLGISRILLQAWNRFLNGPFREHFLGTISKITRSEASWALSDVPAERVFTNQIKTPKSHLVPREATSSSLGIQLLTGQHPGINGQMLHNTAHDLPAAHTYTIILWQEAWAFITAFLDLLVNLFFFFFFEQPQQMDVHAWRSYFAMEK